MGFIEHIPSTNPVPHPAPHPQSKGIGIVGLHEGRTLLLALDRVAHAHAVAGCDTDPGKLAAARDANPALFYTDSYDALLARPEVDIVAVYTPDAHHGEHVVRALEAGKHVICTKPLVNSVEDARGVLTAARGTDRRVLVGQSTRFFEPFLRQRRAFDADELGTVEVADAHYVHRMDWYYEKSPWAARDTDWVFLGLSHPIDLLCWYLGPIVSVQAFGRRSELGSRHSVVGRDTYAVNVLARSGALGRALGHYGAHELPTARNAIELLLYGTKSTSLAQYHDMRYIHLTQDGTEVTEDHLYAGRHYYFNSEVHGMHYGEFANYADHFARALIGGHTASPDLDEGLEVFCVMESVRRSAGAGGTPVDVASVRAEVGLDEPGSGASH
jgi:predicted dehydrogenase